MSTRIMFITIANAVSWRVMNVFILFFIAFDIEFVDYLFIKFGFQLLWNAVGGMGCTSTTATFRLRAMLASMLTAVRAVAMV